MPYKILPFSATDGMLEMVPDSKEIAEIKDVPGI